MKKTQTKLLLTLIILALVNHTVNGTPTSVYTDKKYYQITETVTIIGETEPSTNITILITGFLGEIFNTTITSELNGTFATSYVLPNDTLPGEYTVSISNGEEATTEFTVMSINIEEIFSNLLGIAEYSKEKLEELMNDTYGTGDIPQQVEEQYEHGLEALQEAEDYREDGLYTPALNAIHRAVQHFKNGLHHIFSQTGSSIPQAGVKTLNKISLEERINSTYNTIDKLNSTLQQLKNEEINVSQAENLLEEALEALNNASKALEENDFETAETEYEKAKDLIDEVKELIDEITDEIKPRLALKYQKNFQNRIKQITKTLNKFEHSLNNNKIKKVYNALEKANNQLDKMEEKITSLNNSGYVEELENITHEFKEDLELVNGEELGHAFKNLNKIFANIQSLNQTQNKIQSKTNGTQGIQQQIKKVEQVLETFIEKLEEGKNQEANKIFSKITGGKSLGKSDTKPSNSEGTGVKGK